MDDPILVHSPFIDQSTLAVFGEVHRERNIQSTDSLIKRRLAGEAHYRNIKVESSFYYDFAWEILNS
jgi:hypothetical protein